MTTIPYLYRRLIASGVPHALASKIAKPNAFEEDPSTPTLLLEKDAAVPAETKVNTLIYEKGKDGPQGYWDGSVIKPLVPRFTGYKGALDDLSPAGWWTMGEDNALTDIGVTASKHGSWVQKNGTGVAVYNEPTLLNDGTSDFSTQVTDGGTGADAWAEIPAANFSDWNWTEFTINVVLSTHWSSGRIACRHKLSPSDHNFRFEIASGGLYFAATTATEGNYTNDGPNWTMTQDVPTQVSVTWDTSNDVRLYINGVQTGSAVNFVDPIKNTTPALTFGGSETGNGGLRSHFQHAAVWQRALSATELADLWAASGH